MKLIGRSRILRRLGNYAIEEPENKAFFGVKGLGKSALMDAVFSKRNCRQFAEEYHYLYVRTILMPAKKGDDLVDFLIDRVVNGLDLIDDEELRLELQSNIQSAKEKFQSKDSVLVEALHTIQDYDYNLILVMDEFHNMGRNKAVSSEQYDFMRSLNEQGLLYYWIISDSDFSDVYATAQFTTSFFAQKFNQCRFVVPGNIVFCFVCFFTVCYVIVLNKFFKFIISTIIKNAIVFISSI